VTDRQILKVAFNNRVAAEVATSFVVWTGKIFAPQTTIKNNGKTFGPNVNPLLPYQCWDTRGKPQDFPAYSRNRALY